MQSNFLLDYRALPFCASVLSSYLRCKNGFLKQFVFRP